MIKKLKLEKLSQKELGYLIGLFDGDGHLDNYYRHYDVEFHLNSLKDQDIMCQLLIILKKIEVGILVSSTRTSVIQITDFR